MKKNEFEAIFQTTSRDMNHGAVIDAAGYYVQITRQPAGRRCLYTFDDTPQTRSLIERYELRQPLGIPAKTILNSRTELYHQSIRVCRGGEI